MVRGFSGPFSPLHAMDMRVYTGSGLRKDKNHMSYVRWCIMIRWVETPSTPHFIG
jgi:hypothetical protein